MNRCDWCKGDDLYIKYHDEEWGVPVHDDRKHFEFLMLESMQAGLSWITILRKRENFRKAFDDFDYEKISTYDENKIQELLNNEGIIRYRRKIEATINNANRFMEIQKEYGSFDKYIWGFSDNEVIMNNYDNISEVPPKSDLSDRVSKDLKKKGFKFVGSVTIYAHLQAIGVINDHINSCFKK
ncbi:DNA-3-methyladenine glycosylase I [Clostridium sp. D2Q-11]|uniref:DNA-3-methyladenine glycosylase I n=1 Tax=Anaeromonas frigoriresistens TaxID=2683708 RepID=A0A942Z7J0_9FIRM|nr:DNA-3-methyladenine glycosylase I [Anaeromonas frigoriresistens]MBS4538747.1 DNA-3-methyladenine glycosylase I [Anaeromonas frigoriresistens]